MGSAPRGVLVWLLLVLATLALFVGTFALWVRLQLLDTDNWVTTSSHLVSNQTIDTALSTFLVDQVIAAPGVSEAVGQVPEGSHVVAALRPVATNVVSRQLHTRAGQRAWRAANRAAHRQLIEILNGGGTTVSTGEGAVTLNLKPLVHDVAKSLSGTRPFSLLPTGVRDQLVAAIPDQSGRVVIVRWDQLRTAQNVVTGVRGLAVALPIGAVVLYLLALLFAAGWRRRVTRSIGWLMIVCGALLLVARQLIEPHIVGVLVTDDSVRPAANEAWLIATTWLRNAAYVEIVVGAVLVVGAWLAGPTRIARSLRSPLRSASGSSVRVRP
jgi:hypothetical protein